MTTKKQKSTPPPSQTDGSATDVSRMHVWQIQAVRDVLLVAAVVALFWAGYALRAVTVPLLVALLLAYLFEPVIARLCAHPRLRFTRVKAVSCLMLVVAVILLIGVSIALPLAVAQVGQISADVRNGTMRQRVAKLERFVPAEYEDAFDEVLHRLPGPPRGARVTTEPPAIEPATPPAGDDSTAKPAAERRDDQPVTRADVREIVDEQLRARGPEAEEATDWMKFARGGVDALFKVIASLVKIGLVTFLIPFYFFFFSVSYPDRRGLRHVSCIPETQPRAHARAAPQDGSTWSPASCAAASSSASSWA